MFRSPWNLCCGEPCNKAHPESGGEADNEFLLTAEDSPLEKSGISFPSKTSSSGDQGSFISLGNGGSGEILKHHFAETEVKDGEPIGPLPLNFALRLKDLTSPVEEVCHSSCLPGNRHQYQHPPYTAGTSTRLSTTQRNIPDTPYGNTTTATSLLFSPSSFDDSVVNDQWGEFDVWGRNGVVPSSPKRYSHKRDPSLLRSHRTPRQSDVSKLHTSNNRINSYSPFRIQKLGDFSPARNQHVSHPLIAQGDHQQSPFDSRALTTTTAAVPEDSFRSRNFFEGGRFIQRESSAECSTHTTGAKRRNRDDPHHPQIETVYASPSNAALLFFSNDEDRGREPLDQHDVPEAATLLRGSLERNTEHSNVRVLATPEESCRRALERPGSKAQTADHRVSLSRISLSRVNSMPAEVTTFEQKETSLKRYTVAAVKPGRSDPDGREEKNLERRKEDAIVKENDVDRQEKKRSDPLPTAQSNAEEDAVFLNPPASVIGRFNGWDSSTTNYLQKTRRSAKSVSGSVWTRSVNSFSTHGLLQMLTTSRGVDKDNDLISIGSSTGFMSDDDHDDAESWDSSDYPRQRKNSNSDDNRSARNLPRDWAFVPRRLHSSASLWILVGSSVRRRILADTPDTQDSTD